MPQFHSKYTDEQIKKAVQLKEEGVKIKAIAEQTGIKESSLRNTQWLFNKLKKITG